MTLFACLTPDQLNLERAADALLQSLPKDADCPVYTEAQMVRKSLYAVNVDVLARNVPTPPPAWRDELKFLMSISRMDQEDRRFFSLWTEGWTQKEIATAVGISQQRVSRRIRAALMACYNSIPLSFGEFGKHTIYRPPARGRTKSIIRYCVRCGESYPLGLGNRRYCSSLCQESARSEMHKIRKNRGLTNQTGSGNIYMSSGDGEGNSM